MEKFKKLIGNKNYFNYNDIRKETYNERIKWWVQYSFHHNLIIRHIAKIWLKNINNELQIKKKKTTLTSKL